MSLMPRWSVVLYSSACHTPTNNSWRVIEGAEKFRAQSNPPGVLERPRKIPEEIPNLKTHPRPVRSGIYFSHTN